MKHLIAAVLELVSNSPPDKVDQLARSIAKLPSARESGPVGDWATTPNAKLRLANMIAAWERVEVGPSELAGLVAGAGAAYRHAKAEQEVELVWTGPSSALVATRKTEQALLQVIDGARHKIFITSFVAYDVASIMTALQRALERKVTVTMLLEASDKHGGGVSIDGIGKMKAGLPAAKMLTWSRRAGGFESGKVHAKVAVADESICFVSSANLTGYAMEKNMELGILVRGGALPRDLHRHLEALETTNVITRI